MKTSTNSKSPLSNDDIRVWTQYLSGNSPMSILPITRELPRVKISSVLDLHGLTLQNAFNEFKNWINSHQLAGTKTVKVVTGQSGKIKQEFPIWCSNIPFIKHCDPILNSIGTYGSFKILMK